MPIKIEVPKEDIIYVISGDEEDDSPWTLIETTEWIQDYKYQEREIILQRVSDGTFWKYSEARAGSAFSEYHYEHAYSDTLTLYRVEQVEVTAKEWREM